ncbi:Telomerase reverse transcriptase [Elasticomyces elasticus]|uniref:Telomerase reverse transcriptase n=1 Tax=Exophiala sideris TaxID=1016849 RepID=A0ABR0JAF4_9EURO|nr:Telomerase reverse transcriptase [Elasticomyces elasticus]KAK5026072.1 Telomerase reverse transcriptase [Exophiala sideris]KAK5032327.1 Telomerase reverse transcriptase [Exophiala sideris]KAK5059482.1 Telomerase reverse transcriptase [Exophiala sideris]KAK5186645.1 Telomerase reverse transcriptase [Eurotiomycetes sp. CCFEE 6388]
MLHKRDFVIWSLFRNNFSGIRPHHILCHGLQRASASLDTGDNGDRNSLLPGVVRQHPNDNLKALTSNAWSELLPLLGEDAEIIFASLLLDCGIFVRLSNGKGNYFQLSGIPISELKQNTIPESRTTSTAVPKKPQLKRPAGIRFVRNRILYARPSLNVHGKVKFGLHHTHVLQRFSTVVRSDNTAHIARYVFPRQFGLHNAFTSTVDPAETAQPFKDYTFRELEIEARPKRKSTWMPRRLRGAITPLLRKVQRSHQSLSYTQLLRHYCPAGNPQWQESCTWLQARSIPSTEPLATQVAGPNSSSGRPASDNNAYDDATSFLPHSTPVVAVSAFCRSAIARLLPADTFGRGIEGQRNHKKVMVSIHEFVQMRRFETMTLHKAVDGIAMRAIPWLCAPNQQGQKMSKSDHSKRQELLHEFVYYLFDSLLIPLIRANFYVTESSSHRNRLFYFRHDIWRKLSEPSLAVLRLNMYSAIKPSEARQKLRSRTLGYSHLRLLPKDHGSRPITNLRRRQIKVVSGKRIMSSSINAQLTSVFSALNYERAHDPTPLGSALLSVGEIHDRLTKFKNTLPSESELFFVKVDIKSCFDSIPQEKLLAMVKGLLSETTYRTTRHTELKCLDEVGHTQEGLLRRRYVGSARPADENAVFSVSLANNIASRKRKVVLADTGNNKLLTRSSLLKILQEHVGDSIVKIGKKHMRQIDGIPQGSVLSSLLCSYFYGAFELKELDFLDSKSCMLLRLIDDFLLVTTKKQLARQFLDVMVSGDQRYGIMVNAEKSLVNFDVSIRGKKVPRVHGGRFFPYCGMSIEMTSLALSKDRDRKDAFVSNGLTIESCSRPGTTLRRKVLSSLKLQMHAMLLDLSLNSRKQVIATLLGNFAESAMKMHRYMASLRQDIRASQALIRRLIEELVLAATKICWAKNDNQKRITRTQMCWIAATACESVLLRKQSQYRQVLHWLKMLRENTEASMNMEGKELSKLLEENQKMFNGYVY